MYNLPQSTFSTRRTTTPARRDNIDQANQAASERRKRNNKRIQKGGSLSNAESQEMITRRDAETQLEIEGHEQRIRGTQRFKKCGETWHSTHTHTWKKDAVDVEK